MARLTTPPTETFEILRANIKKTLSAKVLGPLPLQIKVTCEEGTYLIQKKNRELVRCLVREVTRECRTGDECKVEIWRD